MSEDVARPHEGRSAIRESESLTLTSFIDAMLRPMTIAQPSEPPLAQDESADVPIATDVADSPGLSTPQAKVANLREQLPFKMVVFEAGPYRLCLPMQLVNTVEERPAQFKPSEHTRPPRLGQVCSLGLN